jgi:hypothetical protein
MNELSKISQREGDMKDSQGLRTVNGNVRGHAREFLVEGQSRKLALLEPVWAEDGTQTRRGTADPIRLTLCSVISAYRWSPRSVSTKRGVARPTVHLFGAPHRCLELTCPHRLPKGTTVALSSSSAQPACLLQSIRRQNLSALSSAARLHSQA